MAKKKQKVNSKTPRNYTRQLNRANYPIYRRVLRELAAFISLLNNVVVDLNSQKKKTLECFNLSCILPEWLFL